MFRADLGFPKTDQVPEEAYDKALRALEAEKEELLASRQRMQDELTRLAGEYSAELHAIIGKDNLPGLQQLHRRRVREMARLRRTSPRTLEGLVRVHRQRQENIAGFDGLLKRGGVDRTELRSLQDRFKAEAEERLAEFVATGSGATRVPPVLSDTKQWVFTPPFLMQNTAEYGESTKGPSSFQLSPYINYRTGRMWHWSWIHVHDAGDSETVDLHSQADMFSLYGVPEGCSRIWLYAIYHNDHSHSRGDWDPECGNSWLRLRQSARAYFKVQRVWPWGGIDTRVAGMHDPHGNDGYASVDWSDWWLISLFEGGTICTLDWDLFDPGSEVVTDVVLFEGPYEPGDLLGIRAGTEMFHWAHIDDVSLNSTLSYDLTLESVLVYAQ